MAGRPTQFKREALVQAALDEFWSQGYRNLSVKKLCETLGINRSSFYNSFGSLDDLFAEVVELYLSQAPDQRASSDSTPSPKSPTDFVRQAFKSLCYLRSRDPNKRGCLIVNSLSDLQQLPENTQALILSKSELATKTLTYCATQAIECGELPDNSQGKNIGLSLYGLTLAINTLSKIDNRMDTLWALADTTLSGLGFSEAKTRDV